MDRRTLREGRSGGFHIENGVQRPLDAAVPQQPDGLKHTYIGLRRTCNSDGIQLATGPLALRFTISQWKSCLGLGFPETIFRAKKLTIPIVNICLNFTQLEAMPQTPPSPIVQDLIPQAM